MRNWHARLAAWSWPALYGSFLAGFGAFTTAVVVVTDLSISSEDSVELQSAATALMPALGVLFSLLTGFVISNQWTRAREASAVIGVEADAALRLALATRPRGVDGDDTRIRLLTYLDAVIDHEWPAMDAPDTARAGHPDAVASLRRLGDDTRVLAMSDDTSDPVTWDLLGAFESVAMTRRDRLNLAGNGLPAPLFLLVMLSGVALSINAAVLAVGLDRSAGVLIAVLVVVIALDLALIVAISGPFTGHMRVEPRPLEAVRDELRDRITRVD